MSCCGLCVQQIKTAIVDGYLQHRRVVLQARGQAHDGCLIALVGVLVRHGVGDLEVIERGKELPLVSVWRQRGAWLGAKSARRDTCMVSGLLNAAGRMQESR